MTTHDPILVVGAAGAQGGAVLDALARRGARTRALVRDEGDRAAVLARGAAEVAVADLGDAQALARAVEGTEAVFLVTPFETDVAAAGRTAEGVVAGLVQGSARYVVFNTGLIAGMTRAGVGSVDGKLATLEALRRAGIPRVELAVTYYLENWLMPWAAARIASQGVVSYPLPADRPVSWLAQADMGEAAASALTRPELAGRTIQLGGEARTPEEMARLIGAATGRPLRFEPMPLDAFVEGGDAASGPARMGTAIGALYRWTLAQPVAAANVGTRGLEDLGVSPTHPERWAAAQAWAAERAA